MFDCEISRMKQEYNSLLVLCGDLAYKNFVLENKLKHANTHLDILKLPENKN